jgi:hypothetical protein
MNITTNQLQNYVLWLTLNIYIYQAKNMAAFIEESQTEGIILTFCSQTECTPCKNDELEKHWSLISYIFCFSRFVFHIFCCQWRGGQSSQSWLQIPPHIDMCIEIITNYHFPLLVLLPWSCTSAHKTVQLNLHKSAQ